jgi:hypothetical protein
MSSGADPENELWAVSIASWMAGFAEEKGHCTT